MTIPLDTSRHDDLNTDVRLEAALLAGLDSCELIEVDDEWRSRKRVELTARFREERNPKR